MTLADLDEGLTRFSEGGDFDSAWSRASTGPTKRRLPWAGPAVAAAAAAVVCVAGWNAWGPTVDTPASWVEEAGEPDTAVMEGVFLGPGNTRLYTPSGSVKSISLVDPDIVRVEAYGDALEIVGQRPGRTDMVLTFDDDSVQIEEVRVGNHYLPGSGEQIVLAPGTLAVWRAEGIPTAVALVDPDIADVQPLGMPDTLVFQGKRIGGTDVVVRGDWGRRAISVVVDEEPGDHSAIEVSLAVGQALPLELEGRPISVSVVDPDILTVRTLRDDGLLLSGLRPGRTDILVSRGPGVFEHFRATVR